MDKHGEILEGLKIGRKTTIEESKKEATIMSKETYDWGVLRKIQVGHSFSVIIHPEDWEKIESLIKTGEGEYGFKDEQKYYWGVVVSGGKVTFEGNQGKKVTLDLDDVKEQLM